jgi:hypothetical protein
MKDTKEFYIHVRTSYNSPIKKSCAAYTVLPVLPYRFPPPRKLIPHLNPKSTVQLAPGGRGCAKNPVKDFF